MATYAYTPTTPADPASLIYTTQGVPTGLATPSPDPNDPSYQTYLRWYRGGVGVLLAMCGFIVLMVLFIGLTLCALGMWWASVAWGQVDGLKKEVVTKSQEADYWHGQYDLLLARTAVTDTLVLDLRGQVAKLEDEKKNLIDQLQASKDAYNKLVAAIGVDEGDKALGDQIAAQQQQISDLEAEIARLKALQPPPCMPTTGHPPDSP